MKPVYCCQPKRNGDICTQMLFKAASDFTGVVEIKCPRCKTISTIRLREGVVNA